MILTRAIIRSIDSNSTATIEIPSYNVIGGNLPSAKICAPPGCMPAYSEGDVVYISLDDMKLSSPVVLGRMTTNNDDKDTVGRSDLALSSIVVDVNANLPDETHIGSVTSDEIKCLSKVKSSIQTQLDTNIAQKTKLLTALAESAKELTEFLNGL